MLGNLEGPSISFLTPDNPNHRNSTVFLVHSAHCTQNRDEDPVLLLARAKGWPEFMAYNDLSTQLATFIDDPSMIHEDFEASKLLGVTDSDGRGCHLRQEDKEEGASHLVQYSKISSRSRLEINQFDPTGLSGLRTQNVRPSNGWKRG
ncbi:hypothetical protein B0H17DRAFT_1132615 [Mycena rosella]|uniref:Uncharacterized protein n=1 Tax=Mycena rosella TaxID=1033263 RepID=A0AAD7DK20_MYCRO|nr:hypothetical protein B0H17DRAFT_1132615 [Mycena rosella]